MYSWILALKLGVVAMVVKGIGPPVLDVGAQEVRHLWVGVGTPHSRLQSQQEVHSTGLS